MYAVRYTMYDLKICPLLFPHSDVLRTIYDVRFKNLFPFYFRVPMYAVRYTMYALKFVPFYFLSRKLQNILMSPALRDTDPKMYA